MNSNIFDFTQVKLVESDVKITPKDISTANKNGLVKFMVITEKPNSNFFKLSNVLSNEDEIPAIRIGSYDLEGDIDLYALKDLEFEIQFGDRTQAKILKPKCIF